jgi:phospholipid/cholesterol/gamma-HCH transport system substrate-binding protein
MARQLHWRELTTGIVFAAVIVGAVVLTFLFARVGALHGKKVTLYVVADDATGVLAGTEVWVGGMKEGVVKDVSFRPPTTDTLERVLITTQLLKDALPNIRRDSYAQIRPGGSLIGAVIVYVSTGTAPSPGLHDRDTVHVRVSSAMSNLATDVGTIRPELAALIAQVQELNTKRSSTSGTVGSFSAHGLPHMPQVTAQMSRLANKGMSGNGTIGLAMRTDLMGRATRAMAGADSVRSLMTSGKGSLGRFKRDTTLFTTVNGLMAEMDSVSAKMFDPLGSIVRSHSDSALGRALIRNRALLDSLIKDAKKHPFRYINF